MSHPGRAVDPSRLESLRQVDPALVAEIATLWLDTTPALLTALREGVTASDFPAAEKAAHSLRGSSANLGADALASACSVVEAAARREPDDSDPGDGSDSGGLSGLLATVQVEYQRAAAEFAELAGRPVP